MIRIRREALTELRDSAHWHIGNLQQRPSRLQADPWAGYANRQRITQAMWKKLAAEALW